MCDSETLPGPPATITKHDASNIKSIRYPPSPVRFWASFTAKIAPIIIIESNDAEILLKTPMINRIPGINSANAIGMCISGGNPKLSKNPPNPGLPSLDMPATIKITPIDDLSPINEMSTKLRLLISLVATIKEIFFSITILLIVSL